MKKIVSLLLFSFCFGGEGTVHARLNSDHIKAGVSGVATIACALGSWYCFDQAAKLAQEMDLEKQQRMYKILGWVLAGGAAGSGVYCGYKAYDLWKQPNPQPNPQRNPQPNVQSNPQPNSEQRDMNILIKQQFDNLKREGASNEFQMAYNGYEQRILPIIEQHFQDGTALTNGDAQGFMNCYEACIDRIEQLDFPDQLVPERRRDEFQRQQRETTGNILKDHMANLITQKWQGADGYGPIVGALDNLKGAAQAANQNVIVERVGWINGLFMKVRDLELNRVVPDQIQEPEPEPVEQDIDGEIKQSEDLQKDLDDIMKQKRLEKEEALQQALAVNLARDQRIWEFAKLATPPEQIEALRKVEDLNHSRVMRGIAQILARNVQGEELPLAQRNQIIGNIEGMLLGGEERVRAERILDRFME